MSGSAIKWEGKHASYDKPEEWVPEFERRNLSSWMLGKKILASHNERRFRVHAGEESVVAGSSVRLRIEGVVPLAPLAILHGRLNGEPLDLFGEAVVPYEEKLDALVNLPREASPGTYIFLAQQWEPGRSACPGGSFIYASSVASVEVRPYIDDEAFWNSFEPWSEEDAEEIMKNVREARRNTGY